MYRQIRHNRSRSLHGNVPRRMVRPSLHIFVAPNLLRLALQVRADEKDAFVILIGHAVIILDAFRRKMHGNECPVRREVNWNEKQ